MIVSSMRIFIELLLYPIVSDLYFLVYLGVYIYIYILELNEHLS